MSHVFEYSSRGSAAPDDGLFLERLEAFMDKCLAEIKAFSEREQRPFEETRRSIAEWHAKYLFQSSFASKATCATDRRNYVRSILMDASRILESLAETAGIQSFLLAVDPQDTSDPGFLGGSLRGREWWRILRGGGENGAKTFKHYCLKAQPRTDGSDTRSSDGALPHLPTRQSPSAATSRLDAKSLKADLYETIRKALRSISGVRNAEMKWTNPERLDVYGVRLVGWPPGIPSQNPSTLKMNQNKQLLDSFKNGTIRFERLPTSQGFQPSPESPPPTESQSMDDEDFSWAYDADAPTPIVATSVLESPPALSGPSFTAIDSPRWTTGASAQEGVTPLSRVDLRDPWDNFNPTSPHPLDNDNLVSLEWDDDQLRYRKRPRSDGEASSSNSIDSDSRLGPSHSPFPDSLGGL